MYESCRNMIISLFWIWFDQMNLEKFTVPGTQWAADLHVYMKLFHVSTYLQLYKDKDSKAVERAYQTHSGIKSSDLYTSYSYLLSIKSIFVQSVPIVIWCYSYSTRLMCDTLKGCWNTQVPPVAPWSLESKLWVSLLPMWQCSRRRPLPAAARDCTYQYISHVQDCRLIRFDILIIWFCFPNSC